MKKNTQLTSAVTTNCRNEGKNMETDVGECSEKTVEVQAKEPLGQENVENVSEAMDVEPISEDSSKFSSNVTEGSDSNAEGNFTDAGKHLEDESTEETASKYFSLKKDCKTDFPDPGPSDKNSPEEEKKGEIEDEEMKSDESSRKEGNSTPAVVEEASKEMKVCELKENSKVDLGHVGSGDDTKDLV